MDPCTHCLMMKLLADIQSIIPAYVPGVIQIYYLIIMRYKICTYSKMKPGIVHHFIPKGGDSDVIIIKKS